MKQLVILYGHPVKKATANSGHLGEERGQVLPGCCPKPYAQKKGDCPFLFSQMFRCEDSHVRQPRLECLADLPEVSHLQADDERAVGSGFLDLLRGEDLSLGFSLQWCILWDTRKNDRSATDRSFYPMV